MKARECFSLLACCLSCVCHAQQYKLETEPGTPETAMIEHIRLVSDNDARIHLMQQFLERYPKHSAAPWLYDQMRSVYVLRGDNIKVAALCDKLLELNPLDLESAHQSLKIAEAGKDPKAILTNADRVWSIAAKIAASPKPPANPESWTQRVELAKQMATYAEYLYYKRIFDTTDAKTRLALMSDFMRRFPKSGYAKSIPAQQFVILQQSGDRAGALALAERLLQEDGSNLDALYLLAEDRFQRKIDLEKVLHWSGRIVDVLNDATKPLDLSESEWAKKKNLLLGSAYWMSGSIYSSQERFALADKSLRAGLPYLRGGPLIGAALFQLGWANYRLNNIPDAVRFNKECMNLKSAYAAQASRNLAVIKSEFNLE